MKTAAFPSTSGHSTAILKRPVSYGSFHAGLLNGSLIAIILWVAMFLLIQNV